MFSRLFVANNVSPRLGARKLRAWDGNLSARSQSRKVLLSLLKKALYSSGNLVMIGQAYKISLFYLMKRVRSCRCERKSPPLFKP